MLLQDKNKVHADFKSWVDDLKETLSTNQYYKLPIKEISRSTFASLQGTVQGNRKNQKSSSDFNAGQMNPNKKEKVNLIPNRMTGEK
ncbi:hypothetical protein GcM1_248089 [Golovinomyces cichoracearum]|uniref:PH domain-containing protein n=1 Tax=Golovinomyces cichoracearum TaxID=62708 RepID=A0A420ICT4_9PEZI|nr:hypothetical protein GcM1_248089 [Golovinomyces cichoracearum]